MASIVIAREKGQTIVINRDWVVTVVEIRGNKVRLGIKAPLTVPIWRGEVYYGNVTPEPPAPPPEPPPLAAYQPVELAIPPGDDYREGF